MSSVAICSCRALTMSQTVPCRKTMPNSSCPCLGFGELNKNKCLALPPPDPRSTYVASSLYELRYYITKYFAGVLFASYVGKMRKWRKEKTKFSAAYNDELADSDKNIPPPGITNYSEHSSGTFGTVRDVSTTPDGMLTQNVTDIIERIWLETWRIWFHDSSKPRLPGQLHRRRV